MAICMADMFVLSHCVGEFIGGCKLLIFHIINLLCDFEWRFEELDVIFVDNVKVLLRENICIPLPPQDAGNYMSKMAFLW